MTQLIIDGDIIAYKAAATAETPINWGDGLWTLHAHEEDVKKYVDDFIFTLKKDSKCKTPVVVLSDKHNFRKDIAPFYKANRKNTRRPMLLNFAKDYMREKFKATSKENLEADDYMGILAMGYPDSVIWSEDKDLMTIPGKHLVNEDIIEVSLEEADRNFYTQILTGDTTDNYRGCPGVGAVKAAKILKDKHTPFEMWSAVLETFEKAGLTEYEAVLQARLAYIKREDRADLWSPPQETK